MVVFIKSTAIENPLPFFAQYCVYALIGTVYIKQNIVWHKPSIRSFWPPSFYQNVFVSHCCHIVSTSEQQWTFRRSRLKIRWTIKELTQGRWNTDLFIYFVMLWYGLTRKGCGQGEGGGWGWWGVGLLRGTSFLLTPDCYLFLTSFGIYFEITVFKQEI